jgi:uncharacterized membrane protein YqiK
MSTLAYIVFGIIIVCCLILGLVCLWLSRKEN